MNARRTSTSQIWWTVSQRRWLSEHAVAAWRPLGIALELRGCSETDGLSMPGILADVSKIGEGRITSEKKKMKWDVKNYIIHILKSFGFHVSCRGCILVILLEHQWVEGSFVRNHSTNLDPPILGMQMKKVVEIHPPETKQRRNAWIFGSILSINGYVHLWHWNWIVFSARPRHLTAMVSCPSFSALPGEALDTKGQRNVACGYHWGWTYSTGSIPKWQSFT